MKEIELIVKKRDTGKKASADYRRNGETPGVYYAKGEENLNLLTHPLALRDIVYTQMTRIVSLKFEGEETGRRCVLKRVDFDPITDAIVHFDLLGIKDGQSITVDIPFKLIGQSVGVRNGGKLQHVLLKAKVSCLPENLVEYIEVDISKLKIGRAIAIKDLKNTQGLNFEISTETVICHVTRPRVGGGTLGTEGDDDDDEDEESSEAVAEATEEATV